MNTCFTESAVTAFGNYLLSKERLDTLFPDADPSLVYHSDVQNWYPHETN